MSNDFEPLLERREQSIDEQPPLRIHHFLMWTTLTAAIISGCMTLRRWAQNGPPIENRIVIAGLVLGAATIAGALTIAGCGVYWRERGIKFPASPGDWLLTLIAASVMALCSLIGLFWLIVFTFGDDDWMQVYVIVAGLASLLAWLRLTWVAARSQADSKAWRIAFYSLMFFPFAGLLVMCALTAVVPWAIWLDWRNGTPRNWTHWCGVAFGLSLCISLLLATQL